jgi:hypothetical protein
MRRSKDHKLVEMVRSRATTAAFPAAADVEGSIDAEEPVLVLALQPMAVFPFAVTTGLKTRLAPSWKGFCRLSASRRSGLPQGILQMSCPAPMT